MSKNILRRLGAMMGLVSQPSFSVKEDAYDTHRVAPKPKEVEHIHMAVRGKRDPLYLKKAVQGAKVMRQRMGIE